MEYGEVHWRSTGEVPGVLEKSLYTGVLERYLSLEDFNYLLYCTLLVSCNYVLL